MLPLLWIMKRWGGFLFSYSLTASSSRQESESSWIGVVWEPERLPAFLQMQNRDRIVQLPRAKNPPISPGGIFMINSRHHPHNSLWSSQSSAASGKPSDWISGVWLIRCDRVSRRVRCQFVMSSLKRSWRSLMYRIISEYITFSGLSSCSRS